VKTIARWRCLPQADRRLVLQVVPWLLAIRLALKLIPLPALRRALGGAARTLPMSNHSGDVEPMRVAWAVRAASRRLLGDGSCLAQALTTELFLRRVHIPASLCIGVAKDEAGKLVAHAWVESAGTVVIGGTQLRLERYARLVTLDERVS
jgi:hypothetical protein